VFRGVSDLKVLTYTSTTDGEFCGLGDHIARLLANLEILGLECPVMSPSDKPWIRVPKQLVAADPRSLSGFARACSTVAEVSPDVVLVPYIPFMLGRGGISVAFTQWVRHVSARWPTVFVVHEPAATFSLRPKYFAIWLWHALTLGAMLRAVDRVVFSIGYWRNRARRFFMLGDKPCRTIPIGSNIPCAAGPVFATGCGLRLGTFWTQHPGFLGDWVIDAARAIAHRGLSVTLVAFGRSAATMPRHPDYTVEVHGGLDAQAMSTRLASVDVMLLPYRDGVSFRRTTFFAALEHGLPTLTTTGYATDEPGLYRALGAVSTSDRAGFVRVALELAAGAERRQLKAAAANSLHAARFDWKILRRLWFDELHACSYQSQRAGV